jgi:signal peptidase I
MNKKNKKIWLKVANIALDIFNYSVLLLFIYIFSRVFIFSGFSIPTNSMMPAIVPGDYVLVNKTAYGARLFNYFDVFEGKNVNIRRAPGFSRIKRNDVVVFHIPYPNTWDKMEMDMLKYFIKRCIGIAGDTLQIIDGVYVVNSDTATSGNIAAQQMLKYTAPEMLPEGVYHAFPFDSTLNWTIKDFGALYIPRKGDKIVLDRTNIILYKKLIEWENGHPLTFENDSLWDDNSTHLSDYTFTHNYYFMGGDMVENSQDSRYWGLVPEELIVGKATLIWRSKEKYSGKMRWERVWRRIK